MTHYTIEKTLYKTVIKRNGMTVPFDLKRIENAIKAAFKEVRNLQSKEDLSIEDVNFIQGVLEELLRDFQKKESTFLPVEEIQDSIEKSLMLKGFFDIAKSYILYREEHSKRRYLKNRLEERAQEDNPYPFLFQLMDHLKEASKNLKLIDEAGLKNELIKQLYPGISFLEAKQALILIAASQIEKEPEYDFLAARLILSNIDAEVFGKFDNREINHKIYFKNFILKGVEAERLDPKLLEFDLSYLSSVLKPERDDSFKFLGLKILYDRYLLHIDEKRIETPQFFFMRVAMGLALHEKEKEKAAVAFYHTLSSFEYMASTPTLFNSGTLHPQLSSCYLSTVSDSLDHIFKVIGDNAKLSKWAGGIGNDWTNVRASGARIKGTNGLTQGIIPFLKIVNDTAVAVNQGGKRKGSICVYLEVWHLDIEDFLELRKNTGDERRRTHDMNTACWIPDLFMKRVQENGIWTLFNPAETKDLHELTGKAFESRYQEYEEKAKRGELKQSKTLFAFDLWRKMLSQLFETGHPWITFKDPSNVRSVSRIKQVIRSSNLCTEILLPTNEEETAVCNLGSINLVKMFKDGSLEEELLKKTIYNAVRMLDNVIDINFYPTKEAKRSNLRHRPVGLGSMGFQELLFQLKIPYESETALELADEIQEKMAYYAISASLELAKERGRFESFDDSLWSYGIMPLDTLDDLENERGEPIQINRKASLDWESLRQEVILHGLRNSQLQAIAPTATIAQITGTTQSIEPLYSNLFVKSNLSGEFCTINPYLVADLKKLNLWDEGMIENLKYHDGSIQEIESIPIELKALYKTAFEIDSSILIECAARRQKWIDMGQSLNLYISFSDGRKLSDMYFEAWKKGLKTTYYARSKSATQIEKSSYNINKKAIQPKGMKSKSASSRLSCGLSSNCETCE